MLDTFRCPRCKHKYELANPTPPRLHALAMVFDALYVAFSELANVGCTVVGLATLQIIPLALSVQTRLSMIGGMLVYETAFLESYLGPECVFSSAAKSSG